MSWKMVMLLAASLALGFTASRAGDKVRVDLFVGQNEPLAPGAQAAAPQLHHQLEQVFGFAHYRLLKEQDFLLRNEWEQWFMPRRDFFLRLQPLHREPDHPKVIDYEIYKDGFIVVKGTYEPHEDTPLFINGPDFRRGRLILVLQSR